jgi:hypothetical protein
MGPLQFVLLRLKRREIEPPKEIKAEFFSSQRRPDFSLLAWQFCTGVAE